MDFSQIKDLTIPEGSVIFITDSNGNILYNKSMYRELEYIHFDGNSGIVGVHFPQNYQTTYIHYEYKVSWDTITGNNRAFAAYKGSNTSANRRAYIGGCMDSASNHYLRACIGGTWLTYNNLEIQTNTPYIIAFTWATNRIMSLDVNNLGSISTQLTSNVSVNTYPSVGGTYDGDTNALTADSQYNLIGNIYYLKKIDPNSNILIDLIPAQRKSDGVCGLYDKINNIFYPKDCGTGTITAGPVVEESPSWSPKMIAIYTNNTGWSFDTTGVSPTTTTLVNLDAPISEITLSAKVYHGTCDGSAFIRMKDNTGTIVEDTSASSKTVTITNKMGSYAGATSTIAVLTNQASYTSGSRVAYAIMRIDYDPVNLQLRLYRERESGTTTLPNSMYIQNLNIKIRY